MRKERKGKERNVSVLPFFFFFITFRCLEEITIYKDLRKEESIKEREGG